ncbi:MAG: redoxin domain-containing protein [Patescibacteria group bacterium]|nr:redoxin domain-containing protein [Patescibacteria group bacterium]
MENKNKGSNIIKILGIIAVSVFVVGGLFVLGYRNSGITDNAGISDSGDFGGALIGKIAPNFSLRDRNGKVYSNDSLRGKNIVLFFNEGIMCYPACWNQMVALATDPRFQATDTVALSVVIDSPDEWQQAIQQMPELGKAVVLFDTNKVISQEFGMLTAPSSMHYGSYPGHSFVVIDKQGVIRFVYDDPNMGIDNDRIASEIQMLN